MERTKKFQLKWLRKFCLIVFSIGMGRYTFIKGDCMLITFYKVYLRVILIKFMYFALKYNASNRLLGVWFGFVKRNEFEKGTKQQEISQQKKLPSCFTLKRARSRFFIFSPYFIWERKIIKSNVFFSYFGQAPNYLYSTLRVLPIEFNAHKFSFVRYVFVVVSELFWLPQGHQNDPKMRKFDNIPVFLRFNAIFVNFSIDIVDQNVENDQQGTNTLFNRLFQELIAVFQIKVSQIDTENDKKPKTFHFSIFFAIFVKFLTDFVNCNVEKGQQGKNLLSSRLFRKVYWF